MTQGLNGTYLDDNGILWAPFKAYDDLHRAAKQYSDNELFNRADQALYLNRLVEILGDELFTETRKACRIKGPICMNLIRP